VPTECCSTILGACASSPAPAHAQKTLFASSFVLYELAAQCMLPAIGKQMLRDREPLLVPQEVPRSQG